MKALAVFTVMATSANAETAADRFHPQRGINAEIWQNWLTADQMLADDDFLRVYPDWRRAVTPQDRAKLSAMGFDFIRLPMDTAPLLAVGAGAAQDALIAQIVTASQEMQAAGLNVIVDLHNVPRDGTDARWGIDTILASPAAFDDYLMLTRKIAAALTSLPPDRTALEVMNEPTIDCAPIYTPSLPQVWPVLLRRLHDAARTTAPDLPLVLTGACWGGADGLAALTPIADDNVLWSFHSYAPFLFTHQAADWTNDPLSAFRHLPYPPSLIDDPAAAQLVAAAAAKTSTPASDFAAALQSYRTAPFGGIAAEPQQAAAWADAHGIPRARLLMGEFGAHHTAELSLPSDVESRQRFLRDKRDAAESLGIGWAVWVWSGSFGISGTETSHDISAANCIALGLPKCP